MSEETDALFTAQFAVEDVREILRETAPKHALNDAQKKRLTEAIAAAKNALDAIQRRLG